MSKYEASAWENSLQRLTKEPRRLPASSKVATAASKGGRFATRVVDDHLAPEQVREIIESVLAGALGLTFQPALRSVSAESALKAHQEAHHEIRRLEDVRTLDLEQLERSRLDKSRRVLRSAARGTAFSAVSTGAALSKDLSREAKAGAIVLTMAAEAATSMAAMGSTTGAIALRYGFDPSLPDEELFALEVLSLGTARGMVAKQQAMSALSRLSQQLVRGASWEQLNKHLLARVINIVYREVGINLTKKGLTQAVPVVGIFIVGTMSAAETGRLYQRAEDLYRVRFLSEKYGLDPQDWASGNTSPAPSGDMSADVIDVSAILERELASGDSD